MLVIIGVVAALTGSVIINTYVESSTVAKDCGSGTDCYNNDIKTKRKL